MLVKKGRRWVFYLIHFSKVICSPVLGPFNVTGAVRGTVRRIQKKKTSSADDTDEDNDHDYFKCQLRLAPTITTTATTTALDERTAASTELGD